MGSGNETSTTDGLECALSACTWGRGCLNRVRELDLASEKRTVTCTSRQKEIRISHFPFISVFGTVLRANIGVENLM